MSESSPGTSLSRNLTAIVSCIWDELLVLLQQQLDQVYQRQLAV